MHFHFTYYDHVEPQMTCTELKVIFLEKLSGPQERTKSIKPAEEILSFGLLF